MRNILVAELSSAFKRPRDVLPLQSWLLKVRKDSEAAARKVKDQSNDELELSIKLNSAVKLLGFYERSLGSQGNDIRKLEIG